MLKHIVQNSNLKRIDSIPTTIRRTNRTTIALELSPSGLLVRAPYHMTDHEIKAFLDSKSAWIEKHYQAMQERQQREELQNQLPPFTMEEIQSLADKALEVSPTKVKSYAERIGVSYGRITIRNQRTRWGSCSAKGNLNFNCLLMFMPDEVIDSVVVHELCHRKHMNHSPEFYAEIGKILPEYPKHRKWLKENGGRFLSRLP